MFYLIFAPHSQDIVFNLLTIKNLKSEKCISVAYDHSYDFYLCKNIVTYSLLFGIFFKNLSICSAKFGNSKSVWAHVTD